MKKYFIVGLLCAIVGNLKAQNIFPNPGNVGIGTTSPSHPLQINQPVDGIGTISVGSGSGAITGTGTNFLADFNIGDVIIANSETHTITAISSATAMTTDSWSSQITNGPYTTTNANRYAFTGKGALVFGGTTPSSSIAYIQTGRTFTNNSSLFGFQGSLVSNQTNAAFTGFIEGNLINVQVGAGNTQNWTNTSNGAMGQALQVAIQGGASGTITNAVGLSTLVANKSGSAILTNAYGIQNFPNVVNSGVITNYIGSATYNLGVATNNTGVYLTATGGITAPTATTGNYGIYDATGYTSYFSGKLGLGTAAPASALSNLTALPTDNNSYTVHPSGISWKVSGGGNDLYAMSLESYGPYGNGLLIKNSSTGHRSFNIVDASNNVQFYVGDGRIYSGGDIQSVGKFVMGSDLAAIPISNAESMISTYHGLLLVGQRAGAFNAGIASIGDPANVAVPVQDPSKLGFLVRGASSQTADLFQVQNSTQTKLVNVSASGNVGIGTTDNASWQLATSPYKLAVGGNIISEEMVVKQQVNWPDYIFKKNYPLMPLSELKSYIDKNQHLPEIPSAAQIEKDGLNLGEMNKVLVKKVEELTLYMIEKDQQVEAFKNELQSQNVRIKNQDELLKKMAIQLEALTKKNTDK